jgi:hypothetical protein
MIRLGDAPPAEISGRALAFGLTLSGVLWAVVIALGRMIVG